MAVVGQLMVLVGVNNAPLAAGLASSQAQLKGFAGAGSAALNVLKTAVVGIGVATIAGAALGLRAAADFEDAFAGVRKTVDDADLASAGLTFETLAQQFRDMATEIPVAATELAAIGEAAGALGIRAADIEAFTRTVALLGVTTDLTTDAAATALGKVGTILKLTGGDFETFGDTLVALGNNGASTESEIIEVTKRFAAAGKQAGLSTAEILAFSSAITSAGVEPEAAGSSLSRLFGNMILETAKATGTGKNFAQVTGTSFKNWSNLVKNDTVGAMMLLLKSLQGLDKFGQARALGRIGISNVRDVNAIRLLADTYQTNLVPALKIAEEAQGALATEASKRFDTFNSKLTLLGNNFNELLITIGTPLLPIATNFVGSITAGIQTLATSGAALSSTFSPVINAIVAKFQELLPSLQSVAATVMDLATRVWEGGLNKAISTGVTVIGSIIDVLGGLVTAITTNQDAMNILRTTADLIGAGFGLAADAVNTLLGFLGRLGDAIRTNEELMRTLALIGNAISGAFTAAGPAIQAVIDAILEAIRLAGVAAEAIERFAGGAAGGGRSPSTPAASDKPRGFFDPLFAGTGSILGFAGDLVGGAGDQIFRGGQPENAPIQLNNTSNIYLDGDKIGEITDRRLFNNASQTSSGFSRGELR